MRTRQASSRYEEAFKRKVIEEYLETGCTKSSLMLKYNIKSSGAIPTWIARLGYRDVHSLRVCRFVTSNPVIVSQANPHVDDQFELKRRIKELERQLEDVKLRAEAYERIIDKAEKELKIPIRKKPNTR